MLIFLKKNCRLLRLSRRLINGKARRDLLRVCYGRYGCFSLDWPWFSSRRVINSIPKSPRAIRPRFIVYAREEDGVSR